MMTVLYLLVKSAETSLINPAGIFRHCIASESMRISMLSKALLMTCRKMNKGLLCDFTSCIMDSKIAIVAVRQSCIVVSFQDVIGGKDGAEMFVHDSSHQFSGGVK